MKLFMRTMLLLCSLAILAACSSTKETFVSPQGEEDAMAVRQYQPYQYIQKDFSTPIPQWSMRPLYQK